MIAQFSALDVGLREYAFATVNVVQIFVVRLAILGFSTPIFLLAGAVGLVDALVERDLRRWGGGRESGYVFHIAARIIKPAVLWSWVIYLPLVCVPESGPLFELVPASDMELRHGQEINA